jgi:hypothetical protein
MENDTKKEVLLCLNVKIMTDSILLKIISKARYVVTGNFHFKREIRI